MEKEVEYRIVESVVGVEQEDIDLTVYAFYGDRVSHPCSPTSPSSPLGIRFSIFLVFSSECTVGADNKSGSVFRYD